MCMVGDVEDAVTFLLSGKVGGLDRDFDRSSGVLS